MTSNSTAGPNPANIVTVTLVVSSKPWGNDGAAQKWDALLDGELLVGRVRDPEHAACRALLARGITGRVRFIHAATGSEGLSMDIEKGADFAISEGDRLTRVRYVPFGADGMAPRQKIAVAGGVVAGDDLRAADHALLNAAALIDSLTIEERALLDGVAS